MNTVCKNKLSVSDIGRDKKPLTKMINKQQ